MSEKKNDAKAPAPEAAATGAAEGPRKKSPIVPIAVVLFEKGIPLGTALAFMMAVAALSLPEAIMLRTVMRLPLIALFFGVTAAAIMVLGYLLNALAPLL